ncbi:MAG: hypothetical protein KF862_19180 [Chitinophagaceae bacterium]|nr:hypothetical protein [Chitinophagaceae bacterium]
MESLSVLVVLYAGLTHALEADHVLAVSNIVSQRRSVVTAAKDGIFWGLGHISTIAVIGLLMLVFKAGIPEQAFSYFEAVVGLMLIIVAVYRLYKFFRNKEGIVHRHTHVHGGVNEQTHIHAPIDAVEKNLHKTSYGIGLVHGLAGSGALVALAISQFSSPGTGMLYLLLYGLGAVAGMLLVSGLLSVPFSKKIINRPGLRTALILISSGLCLVYGGYVIYHNIA